MTRDTTITPSLSQSLRTCFLGRRGRSQDPFIGLEIHLHAVPDGDGYQADLEVTDRREFPDLPVSLDLTQLRSLSADVDAYGFALGQALFADDACGNAYRETLAVARSANQGLRVRLVVEPPELQEVHWERIYHPFAEGWRPLGTTATTPFSRYVAVRQWDRPAPIDSRPLRVLVVIASPTDLDEWRLDAIPAEERAHLHDLFDNWRDVEPVYLESGSDAPPTLTQIRKALGDGCDLVHCLCHGSHTENGTFLYLEDEAGQVDPVQSDRLVEIVRATSVQPAFVFLAACETARRSRYDAMAPLGPALVDAGGVHAAVAMTEVVGVDTARVFTTQFYTRLMQHGRVDQAVNEARALVQDEWDWGVPVLFMRVPDGRLLTERTPPWCMPVRVALLALVVLLLGGAVAYPFAQPWLNPTQMTGGFNIVVADFGEIAGNGRVRGSPLASRLSATVYQQLNEQLAANVAALPGNQGETLQVWHNTSPQEKNVKLDVIRGASSETRAKAAALLAKRVEADLVIYGYLVDPHVTFTAGGLLPVHAQDTSDESDSASFQLEFYNRSQNYQDQPDAITGRYVVGEPIRLPFDHRAEPTATIQFLSQPLNQRSEAMFWIAKALLLDFLNQQQDALDTMLEARKQLENWQSEEGQALLAYFTGRQALWLRDYELAEEQLDEAIDRDPDYANAYVTLGAVYYDKAQLFYIKPPVPEGLARCVRTDHLERAAQSEEEVHRLLDEAIASVDRGIEIAPDAPWPPIESVAKLVQGNNYRLKGDAFLKEGQLDEARRWFADAIALLNSVQPVFQDQGQQRYVVWTQLARGTTTYLQAFVHVEEVRQGEPMKPELDQAIGLLQQSAAELQQCIDGAVDIQDPVFDEKVVDCGCRYYLNRATEDQRLVQEFLAKQEEVK